MRNGLTNLCEGAASLVVIMSSFFGPALEHHSDAANVFQQGVVFDQVRELKVDSSGEQQIVELAAQHQEIIQGQFRGFQAESHIGSGVVPVQRP